MFLPDNYNDLMRCISVECSLSNYGSDFYGCQFQQIQYSLSIHNNEALVLNFEDYVNDSNQKFMEIGNHSMNSVS